MKEVWTKRVTTNVREYEYDEKGNVKKVKETTIETQAEEKESQLDGLYEKME